VSTTSTTAPSGSTGGAGTSSGTTSFAFAPYVDATVNTPPFDLAADLAATGTKAFTLGFIVSQAGGCNASWGGYYPVSTGYYASGIASLRQAGGDVSISFGGQANQELADVCTTVAALQAQYQSVISTYGLTNVDFDIEGAAETNTASLTRRFQAISGLEAANPGLSVSLTLPVNPTGLDGNGLNVLNAAISAGVHLNVVNIMTMDYGVGQAPNPAGQMGAYAISAARATEAQLATAYPSLTTAQLWHMVGVTPMIGRNDDTDEIFGLSDAQQLDSFAAQVGLGRVSMWAATRDVACAGGAQTYSSDTCSSIAQAPFDFSKIFAA
jgi:hypothetical protein